MVSEREVFDISGPLHLDTVDWTNENHRRSIAGSLVQGVYISERDHQKKRVGSEALASPWWEFFHFHLLSHLVDDEDSSIFGAIYEYKPPQTDFDQPKGGSPLCVIAFRGTLAKRDSFKMDLKLDLHLIRNKLHQTSRCQIAIETVKNMVATFGDSNIWLVGHSLGSAMAMLAGKTMAKTGIFLETYLFNPPYVSAPIERIKATKLKRGIRVANSLITTGFTIAMNSHHHHAEDTFVTLSSWIPRLFVNPADYICSEYIGYFEHRKTMKDMGAGFIEKLATQNSIGALLTNAMKKESPEPAHLIPSANMTINLSPSQDFKQAHGLHQWWKLDSNLETKLYEYR